MQLAKKYKRSEIHKIVLEIALDSKKSGRNYYPHEIKDILEKEYNITITATTVRNILNRAIDANKEKFRELSIFYLASNYKRLSDITDMIYDLNLIFEDENKNKKINLDAVEQIRKNEETLAKMLVHLKDNIEVVNVGVDKDEDIIIDLSHIEVGSEMYEEILEKAVNDDSLVFDEENNELNLDIFNES